MEGHQVDGFDDAHVVEGDVEAELGQGDQAYLVGVRASF